MSRASLLGLLLTACILTACGPGDLMQDDFRPDLGYIGSKSDDRPSWLRPTGQAFGCGESVRGAFADADSAHLFSLSVPAGTAVRLEFTGWYAAERGAAVAAYHADSGELLRLLRNRWDSRVALDFAVADDEEWTVAAYALAWQASGPYELRATCAPRAR